MACLFLTLLLAGCSIEKLAVRKLSSTLGSGVDVFASDSDPELVGDALPFALKTMEALLRSDPENADLLLSACTGYTQYSYAFVELRSEMLKPTDYRGYRHHRTRALNLYLRARDYCLRALDLRLPGASRRLLREPEAVATELGRQDLPLIFWTAGSWGSAISVGLERTELVVDLPVVRALLERCLELDESFEHGLVHDGMLSLEAVPEAMGGSVQRARRHYERSVELSKGRNVGPHLAWAWLVTVGQQDRAGFEEALERALAVDLEAAPENRLANEVNRRFAEFLLSQADDLFLEPLDDSGEEAYEGAGIE